MSDREIVFDEPEEAVLLTRCAVCGHEHDAEWPCDRCAAIRSDESRRKYEREREAEADADLQSRMAAFVEAGKRKLAESAYRCPDGCGTHVLAEGTRCERHAAEYADHVERSQCISVSLYYTPARYTWARFDGPDLGKRVTDAKALCAAKTAAANDAIDRLTFYGFPGAGKTSSAVASYRHIAYARKLNGLFVDARALSLARAQSPLGREADLVSDAMTARLLLLDDLGLESPDQRQSAVADVLYARHANALCTVITLAIAPDAIGPRYGDQIARRLLEADGASACVEVRK